MLHNNVVCSQGSWPSPIAAESIVLTEVSSQVEFSAQRRGTGESSHFIHTAADETVAIQILLKVRFSALHACLRAGMLHVLLRG
jgi:hypothetical protein